MEIWKSIAGYERIYEVSDLGRVRSLNFHREGRTKVLKPGKDRYGYLYVILCKDGIHKHMKVHRLVAQAFLPNPNGLEMVNHRDEVPTNNAVSNLEWCTASYNNNYGTHNQRVAEANINHPKLSKSVQQLDKQGNLLAIFPSTMEAQRVTGIANQHICSCCLGKRKSSGGYVWKYLGDISED